MSYLGRERRQGRQIYGVGSFLQVFTTLLLVVFLQRVGVTPTVAWLISLFLLIYGLVGIWLWELKYAVPERVVPQPLWVGLVVPGFFWQCFACLGVIFSPLLLFCWGAWVWLFTSLAVAFYTLRVCPRWVRYPHKTLELAGLPDGFAGYRVAHLSDIHVGQFISLRRLNRTVDKINHQALDAVFITGDLITFGSHFVPLIAKSLGRIKTRDGVFICLGNHDYYTLKTKDLIDSLRSEGLIVLINQHTIVHRGTSQMAILGIDGVVDLPDVQKKLLVKTLQQVPPDVCCLLLAHDPLVFPAASERGISLTLSGHTHGGQLALPFYHRINSVMVAYPWSIGLYRLGRSLLYVHAGFGLAHFPARFGIRPEVALFTLIPAEANAKMTTTHRTSGAETNYGT